jgi:L-alanine-DL-glutamate epimerase-like enolase superfamily enzyme
LDIEWLWNNMFRAFNFHGYAGTELKALSAIDIALWDIMGKVLGQPIYRLLGGPVRDRIKMYVTCGGSGSTAPGELAKIILDEGITIMKIGAFDRASAQPYLGHYLPPEMLKAGVDIIREIRETLGDSMELGVDLHGRLDVFTAIQISRALEPYNLLFLEDPVTHESEEAIADIKASTRIPVVVSERYFTRYAVRRILEQRAAHVIKIDPVWSGGITECKKIATMTEAFDISFSLHNCYGPVQHLATAHMSFNIPNIWITETLHPAYRAYYNDILTALPVLENGYMIPTEGPGLGAELSPELWDREDAICDTTEEGLVRDLESKMYKQTGYSDPHSPARERS